MQSTLFTIVLFAGLLPITMGQQALLIRVSKADSLDSKSFCDVADMTRFQSHMDTSLGLSNEPRPGQTRALRQLACRGGCVAGYPYCRFTGTGCVTLTRRRIQKTALRSPPRQLQDDKSTGLCRSQLVEFQRQFEAVVPLLKVSCQNYFRTYTSATCEEIVPCAVSHFALWNVDVNVKVVPELKISGESVCQSANVTIQAVTNFDIGPMQFHLMGPAGLNVTKSGHNNPYFLTNGTLAAKTLQPLTMVAGQYKLDAWADNDPSKTVSMWFRVKSC